MWMMMMMKNLQLLQVVFLFMSFGSLLLPKNEIFYSFMYPITNASSAIDIERCENLTKSKGEKFENFIPVQSVVFQLRKQIFISN